MFGRVADPVGRKRLFIGGMAVLGRSPALGGLATSPEALLTARVLQELATAAVTPAGLALLTTTFREGPLRERALGLNGALMSAGFTAGAILGRFRTAQPPYSILARGIETALLPTCERHGMGVLVWSPLAFGFLTGKHRKNRPIDLDSGRAAIRPAFFDPSIAENAAKLDAVEQLIELATDIGCTLPQLAVAFTAAHPAVTSAIIGPRTMHQLDDLLAGAALTLDEETLDRIDTIAPPGTNLYNPATALPPRSLTEKTPRRRPLEERAAA